MRMYASADTCRCWSPLLDGPEHCFRCGKDLLAEPERIGSIDGWDDLWVAIELKRYEMIEDGYFDGHYVVDGLMAAFDELADALDDGLRPDQRAAIAHARQRGAEREAAGLPLPSYL